VPAPIRENVRSAIEQAIRDGHGTVSCRGLARRFGVSADTVSRIAKNAGLSDAFGRTKTKKATQAKIADMAARRAVLAERMLDVAERLVDRVTDPYVHEPSLPSVLHSMTALGIAIDKHMSLIRFDSQGSGSDAVVSLVDALISGFELDANSVDVNDGYPVLLSVPEQPETAPAAGEVT
jgi:hypothetical protein